MHIQPILFKWVGTLVLFCYHIENLNSKNVQNLITMREVRSFGNIFWLYNIKVFDTKKIVTFCKSWGGILELCAKAKSLLISQQVQFFKKKKFKKSKKTYNFMVPLYGWGLFVSKLQIYYKETVFSVSLISRSFCYLFDWLRKDQSLSQLGVAQGFWNQDP